MNMNAPVPVQYRETYRGYKIELYKLYTGREVDWNVEVFQAGKPVYDYVARDRTTALSRGRAYVDQQFQKRIGWVDENPLSHGAQAAIGAAVALVLVGGTIYFATRASASTGVTELSPGDPLLVGKTYWASITPVAGGTVDDGAMGFASVSNNYGVVDGVPASWPSSDVDPTRWRYQFVADTSTTLTNWPVGMRLFQVD